MCYNEEQLMKKEVSVLSDICKELEAHTRFQKELVKSIAGIYERLNDISMAVGLRENGEVEAKPAEDVTRAE